jgi:hypothetical protein
MIKLMDDLKIRITPQLKHHTPNQRFIRFQVRGWIAPFINPEIFVFSHT